MPKPKQSSKKTKARSIRDLPPAKRPSVKGGTSAQFNPRELTITQTVRGGSRAMAPRFGGGQVIRPLLSIVLALWAVSTEAATVTVADVNPAEVTEIAQAAAASVTTLNALSKSKIDLSRAKRSELTSQLSVLQLYLNEIGDYMTEVKLDTRAERKAAREAAEIALREKDRALEANNQAIAAMKEEAGQRYRTAMDAATAQMQIALTAFDNFLASDLAALNLILANLEAKIDSIKQQIDQTRQQIEKLQAAREKAQKMASSKDEAVKTIEDANAEAADARNVALCFTRIAQDRTQAAALIAAIRNNLGNPSGFVPALQTICTFPQVSAQEVREATGLVTVFRTGRLTHCISTKVQCSAKAYSVSP